jgi:hypothetical protein
VDQFEKVPFFSHKGQISGSTGIRAGITGLNFSGFTALKKEMTWPIIYNIEKALFGA